MVEGHISVLTCRRFVIIPLPARRLGTLALSLALVLIAAGGPRLAVVRGATLPPLRWQGPPLPRYLGPATSLRGSLLPAIRAAHLLGTVPSRQTVAVTVALKPQHQTALTALLHALYDPASSHYHAFLTPADYRARFAPSPRQVAGIQAWLRHRGFRHTRVATNGMVIEASAPAATAARAFGTRLNLYRSGAQVFRANASPVRLPAALTSLISGIGGLDTWTHLRPASMLVHAPAAQTQDGYTPAQISTVYNIGPVATRAHGGSGQTVGLVAFAQYQDSVISAFDDTYHVGVTPVRVPVTGGITYDGDSETEVEMDIEVVQGVAPAAAIRVYQGSNDDNGAISVYNRIVSDDQAQTVSSSWGFYESGYPQDVLDAMHNAFQEGAAQGQAFFAAAGDDGAYDQSADTQNGDSNALSVDYPASDPYVTGVGGTTLDAAADGTYQEETAWASTVAKAGSGGGLSGLWKRPDYQQGPGVINSSSNGMRQVPDVAAVADPQTGLAILAASDGGRARWHVIGGTSVSSPLWAAFAALVNGALGHPVGFLNPTLYVLGQKASTFAEAPYHDIVYGYNLKYNAGPGWDFATGWGSMNGSAFVSDLQTLAVPTPTASPAATPIPTATPVPTGTPTAQIVLATPVKGAAVVTATPSRVLAISTPAPRKHKKKKRTRKP